jgi:hypothetical protein
MPDTTEDMVAEAPDAINVAAEPPSGPTKEFDLFEYFSIGSHVGKTLFANFTAELLTTVFGREVIVVRIESKGSLSAGDIHINSEDFAASARLPGGEVALLRPVFDLLESMAQKEVRPVIVIDWGGGLSEYRAKIWAATRIDKRLADLNMRCLSVVTTTSLMDRMRHATKLIEQTRLITPGLNLVLLLNRRVGGFTFIQGSEEARVFHELRKAAEGISIIKAQSITGESWQSCEAAGLSMSEVINADLRTLQHRLGGESSFVASAYQMQVAAWWKNTERAFLNILGAASATQR